MQQKILVVGTAALLALCCFWLTTREEAPVGPNQESTQRISLPATSIGSDSDLATHESAPARKLVDLEPDWIESDRPIEEAPAIGFPVLVLDSQSGEPIRDADVHVVDRDRVDDPWLQENWGRLHVIDALVDGFSRRYRTDDVGEVVVSAPSGEVLVTARSGEHWGRTHFRAGGSMPVRVLVAADPVLRVRVLDHRGQPCVGVPIELLYNNGENHYQATASETQGPNGVATLRHTMVRMGAAKFGIVLVALPFLEGPRYDFQVNEFPRGVIDLRLPPTGKVRVEVDGDPSLEGFHVLLNIIELGQVGNDYGGGSLATYGSGRTNGNLLTFERVELNRDLLIFTQAVVAGSRLVDSTRLRAVGPKEPGELVNVIVERPVSPPVVHFLVRDIEGEVLSNSNILCPIGRGRGGSGDRKWTDAKGLLSLPLFRPAPGEAAMSCSAWRVRSAGVVEGLFFALPMELDPGAGDPGELVFGKAPLLIKGFVRDLQGNGVPGALVTIYPPERQEAERQEGNSETKLDWPRLLEVQANAHGEFEIRAPQDGGRFQIHARAGGFATTPITEFESGTSDYSLVLKRAGRLAARIMPGENLNLTLVEARLELIPVGAAESSFYTASPDRSGRFHWEGLPTGNATLRVFANADADPLMSIEGIRVESAEEVQDKRLESIELPGPLIHTTVRLQNEAGPQLFAFSISYKQPGNSEYAGVVHGSEGVAHLLSAKSRLDFSLHTYGHRELVLEGASGDQTVEMEELIRLRVQLDPVPTSFKQAAPLQVKLIEEVVGRPGRVRRRGLNPIMTSRELDSKGGADLELERAGAYRVVLGVGAQSVELGGVSPGWIEVLDEATHQVFVIAVPESEVVRALEAAQKKMRGLSGPGDLGY